MTLPVPRRRDDRPTGSGEFERLWSSFERDLERWPDVFRKLGTSFEHLERAVREVVPHADLEERDDGWVLDVELPGVEHDDVSLEVDQGVLVVTGQRRDRERVGLLRHRTRTTGRYRLSLTLPPDVEGDDITASLEHGVLTVFLPKAQDARRRHVPVGGKGR